MHIGNFKTKYETKYGYNNVRTFSTILFVRIIYPDILLIFSIFLFKVPTAYIYSW